MVERRGRNTTTFVRLPVWEAEISLTPKTDDIRIEYQSELKDFVPKFLGDLYKNEDVISQTLMDSVFLALMKVNIKKKLFNWLPKGLDHWGPFFW